MKTRDVNELEAKWNTYEDVLRVLRQLLNRVFLLSFFALRALCFTEPELQQLESHAMGYVLALFARFFFTVGTIPLHS